MPRCKTVSAIRQVLPRRWLNWRSRRFLRKALALKYKARNCAVRCLRDIYSDSPDISRDIAVEKRDRTFRPAEWDELSEILACASGSSSAWLFVFAPNDLLAGTNVLLGQVV